MKKEDVKQVLGVILNCATSEDYAGESNPVAEASIKTAIDLLRAELDRHEHTAKAWWIEDEDGDLRNIVPSPITDDTYVSEGWIAIPLYKDAP